MREGLYLLQSFLSLFYALATPALPKEFEVQQDVVYVEQDGEKLLADIYTPALGKGPFPGVLVVHGGAWMSGEKTQLAPIAKALAKNGYTSMAINYRLAPKHPFPAQIEDCRAAVKFMRTHVDQYKIDPERIGGYGYSAGGHLVALLGTEPVTEDTEVSTRLQAVIAGGAPLDFRSLPPTSRLLAYWLGGTRQEVPKLYRLASPAQFVTADDPPFFFFHGEKDAIVPIVSPASMLKLLQAVQVDTEMYTVLGAGHVGAIFDKEAWQKALAFLDRRLKDEVASK